MCGGTCTYVCGVGISQVLPRLQLHQHGWYSGTSIFLYCSFSRFPPPSFPLPSPSLCECACARVVPEIDPGLQAFSACVLDGPRATHIFFPLCSEPRTRVSLATLLWEDLGLHTQHSGASLHSCGLLPKAMIKVALQGLHLELGGSQAGHNLRGTTATCSPWSLEMPAHPIEVAFLSLHPKAP